MLRPTALALNPTRYLQTSSLSAAHSIRSRKDRCSVCNPIIAPRPDHTFNNLFSTKDTYMSAKMLTTDSVPLSQLEPKACLTCGREITPRAKWSKNWSSIRTCSDSCKAQRPGISRNRARWQTAVTLAERVGVTTTGQATEGDGDCQGDEVDSYEDLFDLVVTGDKWQTSVRGSITLQRAELPKNGHQSSDSETSKTFVNCTVDADAWIERTLFQFASEGGSGSVAGGGSNDKSKKSKKANHPGRSMATCEDAELAIAEDARVLMTVFPVLGRSVHKVSTEENNEDNAANPSSTSQTENPDSEDRRPSGQENQDEGPNYLHPLRRALEANPGLRERVRRAARRLAVLDPSLWASSSLKLRCPTVAEDQTEDGVPPCQRRFSDANRLELWNEGRRMEGLADVSHAKGTIGIRLVPL